MNIPFFDYRKPKPVEKKKGNKIILMANQKGGVGKSTNGILFANYLIDKGIRLAMVDADPQQSIKEKHDEDMKAYPNYSELYPVRTFLDLDSEEATTKFLADLRKEDFDIIIDSPGNLSLQGMIPLILGVDVIISPFQYEETCLASLSAFINLNIQICGNAGRERITPMIFLPNMHNKTWGRKDELENDKKIEEALWSIGLVAPKVPSSPEIRRYTSLFTTVKQREQTAPCYDFLHANIYKDIIQVR